MCSTLMKMAIMLKPNSSILIGLIVFIVFALIWLKKNYVQDHMSAEDKVNLAWKTYKDTFLVDGMVLRNKSNDVVSEGQAYAMIRSALMNDRALFDECFMWTENNLSRFDSFGDNLLAWNFKNGRVLDWMAASDADLDYAFALVLAHIRWGDKKYLDKAEAVMADIIKHETYRNDSGRLYLLPWHNSNGAKVNGRIVQNPSYYSPAYFRLFHKITQEDKWMELLDTNYFMINSFLNQDGIDLLPDWCSVDYNDYFGPQKGKSSAFAWDALRIPIRLALDEFLFDDARSKNILKKLNDFFIVKIKTNKSLKAGYDLNGKVNLHYENPTMYAVAIILADRFSEDIEARERLRRKFDSYLRLDDLGMFYGETNDYYTNSLVWLVDWIDYLKEDQYDFKKRIIEFVG